MLLGVLVLVFFFFLRKKKVKTFESARSILLLNLG